MSRFVTYPKPGATGTIRRFEPAYWTVDFPIAMMATVVTTGPNSLRLKALFRTNRDLMGLIWEVEDRDDHGAYAYPRRKDYRGCVLEFDWASSGIRQIDRLQSVTLTVETFTHGTHFIRIWNYKTSGTPDACHIRMVFDQSTRSGFYADTFVPWEDVRRMFISLQPLAAGRGDCSLVTAAANGATSITLNVGDGGPITPGAQVYILGSSFDVPAYTVTSTTSGAVQTVTITPPISTTGGFSIPAGSEAFVQTATDEQIGESPAQVDITNVSVTGPNSTLPMLTTPQPAHALRMTDGYDNAYPFTPQRLVDQVHALGYRGPYVLYMGISKFHSLSWHAGESRYVVDPAKPKLNAPTVQWLQDFFARLHAKGFTIIVSVSFEILAQFMPSPWKQRDANGNEAQTGWEPPSSLIAPTNTAGLAYLRDVFLDTLALLPGGADVHFQIGEPWWWDGSYGTNAPHIYDATTEAAYVAATGQAVPTPRLTSVYGQPPAPQLPYLQWCRDQLGVATNWLVAQVKAVHASAITYLLVFTPQILRGDAPMLRTLNFPEAAWKHPAFDVLQIEDYDKIVEGDYAFTDLTWELATTVLQYPKDQIDYFAGFNLLPDTTWIWFNTDKAIWRAFNEAPKDVYVWSREQVMRDGWLFDEQAWKVYPAVTRLAQCWRIDRTDGVTQAFTSFDKPLIVDGITYQPANSFSASQLASDTDMSVADVELLGALDSEDIQASDLLAGVYDHAEVELFLVDWGDLSLPRTVVRRGWIGTISQAGIAFRAELRGLGQRIQQPVIDTYSAECRVDLYSAPCGVNRAAFAVSATVTALTDGSLGAASDNRVFFASSLGQPDGWFDYGEIWWTGGANAGRKTEVRDFRGGRIELWEPMGLDIAVGDTFAIHAGCDKAFATCKAKFANGLNFRGEPHVPGNDAMLRYPDPKA
ncbi:DUF2163 domain-containing protein [Sphingobium sp.]|uniref:DUF2163 domain-containing protein n=1 Tax=Sphingobium sp. TaxID=1912891 RepID=UPI00262B196C|nr:DUF2163 domain-containing protein [Sphingobium sp.]